MPSSIFGLFKNIKTLGFVVSFFIIIPISVFTFTHKLNSFFRTNEVYSKDTHLNFGSYNQVLVYAAKPESSSGVSSEINLKDARSEILRNYLSRNNSPLTDYSDLIIEVSDRYGFDYRLMIAIAKKESGLCRVIPENSHNCWGWGIHSKGTLKFDSYNQSIQTVARGLKKDYMDKGYVGVDEIMQKWVPHSPDGIWATNVKAFMDEIQ